VPTTPHQFGDYMLFEDYQEGTLNHHCMNAAEMGVFLDFLPMIAVSYQPSGKSTVHYHVIDDTAPGNNGWVDFWFMIHKTNIKYGIYHIGSQSPPTN
jgi:hypothetical protein